MKRAILTTLLSSPAVAADDGVLARRGTTARHNRAANRYFARRAAWLAAGEQAVRVQPLRVL